MDYLIITLLQTFSMNITYKKTIGINGGYRIILDGKEKLDCIEIYIYNNDTTAKLQQIDYDKQCNLQGNMENGVGTKDMINASLYAIKHIFKEKITNIKLDDCSILKCSNGRTPGLRYYNYAFKGQTWYESNFSALPANTKLEKSYRKVKDFLIKDKTNSTEWFEKIINHLEQNTIKNLLELYVKTETYKDFFDLLKKEYTINYCLKEFDWVEKIFIENAIYIPVPWIIQLSRYSECSNFITIKKV